MKAMSRSPAQALPADMPMEQTHQWTLDVTLTPTQARTWAEGSPLTLTVTPNHEANGTPAPLVLCAGCYRLVTRQGLHDRCSGIRP